MKAPAVLWRCEPPSGSPDLADFTRYVRAYPAVDRTKTSLVRALVDTQGA